MKQEASTPVEFAFVCSLSGGLHARPASHLAEMANRFASDCILTNLRTGSNASLKSVLAIIAADVRYNDHCSVQICGADEQTTHSELRRFVEEVLPGSDVPLNEVVSRGSAAPRVLQAAGILCHFGFSASQGIAQGKVVLFDGMALPKSLGDQAAHDPKTELQLVQRALSAVRAGIREKLAHAGSPTEAAVLQAEFAIASDVTLAEKLEEHTFQGRSAGQAVVKAGEDVFPHGHARIGLDALERPTHSERGTAVRP